MAGLLSAFDAIVGEKRVLHDEPLASHTLLKLTSKAAYYIEIDTIETIVKVVTQARKLGIPVYILGSGARTEGNKPIAGLVIKNACRKFDMYKIKGSREKALGQELVYAESGVIMNQLTRYTIEEGLEGLEYQLGLPGTVGGAIYTNAKYIPNYRLVSQAMQSITLLHEDGTVQTYAKELPHFVFTDETWEPSTDIILSVVFALSRGDKKVLWQRAEEAVRWREEEAKKRELQ